SPGTAVESGQRLGHASAEELQYLLQGGQVLPVGSGQQPLQVRFELHQRIGQVEVRRLQLVAAADQQCEVDDILQLAGVARPGVPLQQQLGGRADQRQRQTQALRIDAKEIFGQRQDVARALAQG